MTLHHLALLFLRKSDFRYPCAMFSLFRKRRKPPVFDALPAPDAPFVVLGDLHGSDGLLERMLARLEAEAVPGPVICVGDYVDRGENSARVIDLLIERQARPSAWPFPSAQDTSQRARTGMRPAAGVGESHRRCACVI